MFSSILISLKPEFSNMNINIFLSDGYISFGTLISIISSNIFYQLSFVQFNKRRISS